MISIGISGGIGTGKTTVCESFDSSGIPVYYADLAAHRIMESDRKVIEEISKNFGSNLYFNGRLDRISLGKIVFKDKEKLKILNGIVHPEVYKDIENWLRLQEIYGFPVVLVESPLLFQTDFWKRFDETILVNSELDAVIERVTKRNPKLNKDDVLNRIESQSKSENEFFATYTINNNSTTEELLKKVYALKIKLEERGVEKGIKELSPQDILECNKRIAKFMDSRYYDIQTDNELDSSYTCTDTSVRLIIPFISKLAYQAINHLRFHESWDWLMPVIDKIHQDRLCPSGIIIDPKNNLCYHEKGIKLFQGVSSIDSFYRIVIYSIDYLKILKNEENSNT